MGATIDLDRLATTPTWLEAIEIRKQCGMSAMEFGERLTRFGDVPTPEALFDDVELMEAFAVALWLSARRGGDETPWAEYQAALTLDDFTAAIGSAEAAPANRAGRRAAARKKKPAKRAG